MAFKTLDVGQWKSLGNKYDNHYDYPDSALRESFQALAQRGVTKGCLEDSLSGARETENQAE